MNSRLQTINGDSVLEITETRPVTVRYSEKFLMRRRDYLEQAIAKFEGQLATVNEQISMIHERKNRA